ncbi:RDD family protein [Metabacillus sp. 113a]|uniref:RDD family protein n=1 Tax=Metabacillus sp. 113a TaxID=3404706 RepID=UPI003CE8ACBC
MYAGFWQRAGAYLLDGIVGNLIIFVFLFFMAGVDLLVRSIGMDESVRQFVIGSISFVVYLSSNWLYYAVMESSGTQATLGKMAVGIVVTDQEYKRISFGRATVRYFASLLSILIFFIGFIIAGFTEKKQALHDFLAGTYVLKKEAGQAADRPAAS